MNKSLKAKRDELIESECIPIEMPSDAQEIFHNIPLNGYRSNKPQFNGGLWAFPSASTIRLEFKTDSDTSKQK